ncbi:MAG: signal peptidase II [Patescibacteria group bacterium]|nr:signal peptidase II [Patescibacteria group bacterium]
MPSFINKKTAYCLYVAVFLLLFDRFLKIFIWFNQDFEYQIIKEYFKISFVLNPYIAFSLPLSGSILITVIIVILILLLLAIIRLYLARNYYASGLFSIIFLGASSNLYDRFKYGAVIDYFDLRYFTVFNLADSMIVVAAIVLIFTLSSKKSAFTFSDQ